MEAPFFVGFGIGALGAVHCVGMCGPFVFALPLKNYGFVKRVTYALLYHISRILVYLILASFLAYFGDVIWRIGLFNMVSVILGISILLYKFLYFFKKTSFFIEIKIYTFFSRKIGSLLRQKNKTVITFLFLGGLNGLLPCGLIYTALNASFLYKSPKESVLLMFGFGLATIPVLLLLRILKIRVPRIISSKWGYIQSFILIILAFFLIIRGLKINIPKLSPLIKEEILCH